MQYSYLYNKKDAHIIIIIIIIINCSWLSSGGSG
jgi:hypothetical protein